MFGLLFDRLYDRSPKWRDVRNLHIKNNPTCAACGRKDGLEVHHIIPYNVSPERELDPSNLITLCSKSCHFLFGHLCDWKSWNAEVVEDCDKHLKKIINRPYLNKFHNTYLMETKHENIYGYFISALYHICFFWYNRSKK